MAIRIIPDSLPKGFSRYVLSPMDECLRTEMEVGARRMRRLSLDRHDTIEVAWRFNGPEMELFRAWYADEYRSDLGSSENLEGWTNTGSIDWNSNNDPLKAVAGPDGDMSSRFVAAATTGTHRIAKSIPAAVREDNADYVFVASVRNAGAPVARVDMGGMDNVSRGAYVTLSDGVPTIFGGATVTTKDRGNGWFRVTVRATMGSGASTPSCRIFACPAVWTTTFAGNGSSGLDVCEVMGKRATGGSFDLPAKCLATGEVYGAGMGAEWFNLPLTVGDRWTIKTARFVEPWRATALPGNNWEVTARLESADGR